MMAVYHDPLPLFVVVSYDSGRTTPLYVTLNESEAEGFRQHFNRCRIEAGSKIRAAVLQGMALYPCAADSQAAEPNPLGYRGTSGIDHRIDVRVERESLRKLAAEGGAL